MIKKRRGIKLAFILLFAALILMIPQVIRFMNYESLAIGDESYYHARIAEEISEKGLIDHDSLSYAGRDYHFNIYHYVLLPFVLIFGRSLASMLVPFLCGLLSVLFIFLILEGFKVNSLERIVIMVILLLTPVFVGVFSTSSPKALLLMIVTVGFYFMQKSRKIFTFLAVLFFAAAAFFGVYHLIILFILLLVFSLANADKKEKCYLILGIFLLVALLYYVPFYFSNSFGINSFVKADFVRNFIVDFGGMFGLGIFTLLLSLLGLAVAWGEKKKYYLSCLVFVGLLILSFISNKGIIYSNLAVSFFAGIAVTKLLVMRWKIRPLKNFAILLIVCGLLFSTISYTTRLSNGDPNLELNEALTWINENSDEGSVVFSHYSNGFWIEGIAGRPVVMDSLFSYAPDVKERYGDSEEALHSLDIRVTRKILSRYNVRYVLITENMYDIVWEKKGRGLSYLLQNSETFKKEFKNPYAEVWGYIYEE